MKKFLKKLCLFCLPLFVVFIFPAVVLFFSGEMTSAERAIQIQKKEPALFGMAYSNPVKYYKLHAFLKRNSEISAIGASRVLPIRSEYFKEPGKFYNAGSTANTVYNFRHFLQQVPSGREPKILFVGVEQTFFNPKLQAVSAFDPAFSSGQTSDRVLNIFTSSWYKTYQDFWAGKYSWKNLSPEEDDKIGLAARARGTGFRSDGTYAFHKTVTDFQNPHDADYEFKLTFKKIQDGNFSFERSSEISADAMTEMQRFLDLCKQRNIYVIGFLPPYAHAVYQKMKASDGFEYFFKLPGALKPEFEKRGFKFYDFSDLAMLGAGDAESYDFIHGSEKAYARMLLKMADADPVLAEKLDLEKIRYWLAHSPSDLEIVSP